MTPVYTEDYKGCTIEIWYDELTESPREWDHIEKLYTWERDYHSPDETPAETAAFRDGDYTEDERLETLGLDGEIVHWSYISKYEHSGVAYRPGSPSQFPDSQWDAGYVGIAVVYKADYEKCCEPWEGTDEQIQRCRDAIRIALEEYTDWCNGNCHGYTVTDWNGEVIDSCGGFIGDYDGYVLDEAKRAVEYHVDEMLRKAGVALIAGV